MLIDLAESVPSIGTPTIALLAKSPHTNASRLFLNWIMGKEGQDILGKFLSAASIRKDVANYSPPALKVQYTKLIQLSQQDDENAAQVQQDKILSKMWRKNSRPVNSLTAINTLSIHYPGPPSGG